MPGTKNPRVLALRICSHTTASRRDAMGTSTSAASRVLITLLCIRSALCGGLRVWFGVLVWGFFCCWWWWCLFCCLGSFLLEGVGLDRVFSVMKKLLKTLLLLAVFKYNALMSHQGSFHSKAGTVVHRAAPSDSSSRDGW